MTRPVLETCEACGAHVWRASIDAGGALALDADPAPEGLGEYVMVVRRGTLRAVALTDHPDPSRFERQWVAHQCDGGDHFVVVPT